jgi:uncharacterized protein (TIGR02118 family)
MIKMVYCIKKKCELSSEEFFDRWTHAHAQMGSRIPGVKKHVQNFVVLHEGGIGQTIDGIVELWFESLDSLIQAQQSLQWREVIVDQEEFTEPGHGMMFLCEEHEITLV